jgi:hypothetical protein
MSPYSWRYEAVCILYMGVNRVLLVSFQRDACLHEEVLLDVESLGRGTLSKGLT